MRELDSTKRKPGWFKMCPVDFLADRNVERMTLEEFGLYNYLLMRGWIDGGIPVSLQEMGRYAMLRGIPPKRLERLWQSVKICWVPSPDSTVFINPRQEIERKLASDYWEHQSRAGKAGAEKRLKNKGADVTADVTAAQPTFNHGSAILDPDIDPDIEHTPCADAGGCGTLLPGWKPYRPVLERVARSIHARHPSEHGRRDCSVSYVEKKLAAILKHKRVPAAECEAYLLRIDRNHAAMCASDDWRKENGQFAKGLRNYFAPTEERYDVEPAPARKEPVRLIA
jgi:hypothetical protein